MREKWSKCSVAAGHSRDVKLMISCRGHRLKQQRTPVPFSITCSSAAAMLPFHTRLPPILVPGGRVKTRAHQENPSTALNKDFEASLRRAIMRRKYTKYGRRWAPRPPSLCKNYSPTVPVAFFSSASVKTINQSVFLSTNSCTPGVSACTAWISIPLRLSSGGRQYK